MPRPDRPGKKRIKNKGELAKDTTRIFALNVNYGQQTAWSVVHDPNQLQKLVFPILEKWFQEGTFKMNVIRAVLMFADQMPDEEYVLLEENERVLKAQTKLLGDRLVDYLHKNLRLNLSSTQYPQAPLEPEDTEEDSYLRKLLRFEND